MRKGARRSMVVFMAGNGVALLLPGKISSMETIIGMRCVCSEVHDAE